MTEVRTEHFGLADIDFNVTQRLRFEYRWRWVQGPFFQVLLVDIPVLVNATSLFLFFFAQHAL